MGNYYRMVGTQDPSAAGIDRVLVEEATEDHDEKVLELNGEPQLLEPYQAERVNRYVKIELVEDYDPVADVELVDQPGVLATSSSTEKPPVKGSTPNVDELGFKDLQKLAQEEEIPGRGNKNEDELRELVRDHLATKGV